MMERLLRIFDAIRTRRRAALITAWALLFTSLPPAILLYSNLRAAIEELLPRTAPSIEAIHRLHARLGDNIQLAIYVTGAPSEQLHRFADEFARRSLTLKEGAPRMVDFHPKELQDFFGKRKVLFAGLKDLEELEQRVKDRVAYEKKRANPFWIGLDDDEKPPSFDDVIHRHQERASLFRTYESGYYDGADGQSLAMIFYASSGMTGYEASLAFRDRIHELGRTVAQELGLSGLRFQFTGDIESVIQEQRSLQSDVITSTLVVLVLEALLLLAFYRWAPSILALGFPLAIGTFSTFAIAYFKIGSLNASSAFLGSIIVGNGINSGIILLSRYIEERRRGAAPSEAMPIALRGTLVVTLIASSAAAVSYGALMVTDFRGYSHFGFMGGVGMLLCWLVTFLLLPTVTLALEERWPLSPTASESGAAKWAFHAIGTFSVGHPVAVAAACAALTAVSAVGIAQLAPDPIDHDTTHLRSRAATEPGGTAEVDAKVDAILKRVLTPVVILTETEAQARPLARLFEERLAGQGEHLMGTVLTLRSLVPDDQDRKIEILQRIRKQLRPERVAKLDAESRKLVQDWLLSAELKSFTDRDLPDEVRRQFRENDGGEGRLVLLFPKHGTRTTDGRVVQQLAQEVRAVPLPPGAIAAGSYLVFADMFEAIGRDGPLSTVAALLAVFLLSMVLARGAQGTFAVTLSLLVGVAWTVGIASLFGMRFNFLNFIALPITFGIGVDYATNVYGRFRLEPPSRENLIRAVSQSGGAVAVCSGTTIIGYSSLLFSRNGALFSFGALAVLGELACLAAALFLLPAILSLRLAPEPPAHQIHAESL